jgi:hypothetical protein
MNLSTFIVAVFCLVDDRLEERRIRQRGPTPKLSDSEVPTIEIVGDVGEFLGLDTDKAIHLFFRRHYGDESLEEAAGGTTRQELGTLLSLDTAIPDGTSL